MTPRLSAADYAVSQAADAFAVLRNSVAMTTLAGNALLLPTQPLAEAIAGEWRAQKDKINHAAMSLMQLASTAIDITRRDRAAAVKEVAGYAESDLLYFFAEGPEKLVQRQKKTWEPALDWCARHLNAPFRTGQGIMPVRQPPEVLEAMQRAVESYDDFMLTGIKHAAETAGSLILALALAESHMTAAEVFEAAELDAQFQGERWGEDPVTEKREESILNDLTACEKWFALLKA